MSYSPPVSSNHFEVPVFYERDDGDPFSRQEEDELNFVDEAPVLPNILPESDDEGSDKEDFLDIIPVTEDPTHSLAVGQVYYDKKMIKRVVLHHALASSRNLKQYRHDTNKLGYECVGGNCSWKVYYSVSAHDDKWVVRSFNDLHSCIPDGHCELLKVSTIPKMFLDKIREEPDWFMPRRIEAFIKEKWNLTASRPHCQAARRMTLKWISDAYDEQFGRLRDYAVETITSVEGVDVFNRFYVCYEAIKRSWKDNCRPLIGLDGCFMRSKMKGQILVTLGRDENNQIYPIAWGFVQKEDTDNWSWFIQKLRSDLDLEDRFGFVIISDRQKGLLNAVEKELPMVEHRMCVRHIYANLKKKHGKKKNMKQLIWQLAWAFNMGDYNDTLKEIEKFHSGVYQDVLEAKPETWCRAFQLIGSCCEDVDNNSIESFNATIVKARERPLVPCMEMIARFAMVRICMRSIVALEHSGRVTPYASKVLEDLEQAASKYIGYRGTNNYYKVKLFGATSMVNLNTRSCTCRKWDIRGILCEHAYKVIKDRRMEAEDYIVPWYRKETWIKIYADGILPTRGISFWQHGEGPPIQKPDSSTQTGRKKASRKKQTRLKGVNESPTKKNPKALRRIMHYGVCGAANHNSKFHKKGQSTQSQGEQCGSQEVPEMASQSQGE